jgi:hypothetical protein
MKPSQWEQQDTRDWSVATWAAFEIRWAFQEDPVSGLMGWLLAIRSAMSPPCLLSPLQ